MFFIIHVFDNILAFISLLDGVFPIELDYLVCHSTIILLVNVVKLITITQTKSFKFQVLNLEGWQIRYKSNSVSFLIEI